MKFPLTTRTVRPEHCDPLYLLRELGAGREYCALLESADRDHGTNDFSFLALGHRDVITVVDGYVRGSQFVADGPVRDPLTPFAELMENDGQGELLQMGYIGYLSFESVRFFEDIDLDPNPRVPDAVFVLPEVILRIDHRAHEVTIIAHEDTAEDLDHIVQTVEQSPFWDDDQQHVESVRAEELPLPSLEDIAPYRQMSKSDHAQAVEQIREDILAGEVFQVVLSQELKLENGIDPVQVYAQLRAINPSPYMYYWKIPGSTIVGASPETLLRVSGRSLLYRPIAGTRKRTGDPAVDQRMKDELLRDEKERCEHQMLIDLGRNDIGRVAEVGSVQVTDPFHVERYSHVFHIVSDIQAQLRSDCTSLDALRSVFPAGTLTGAPKLRALETIRRLEQSPRGIYGGAFGYLDLSGDLDMAITIRTMHFMDDHISLRVGGGIVLDSIPQYEDNECLHKARSCLAAVLGAQRQMANGKWKMVNEDSKAH